MAGRNMRDHQSDSCHDAFGLCRKAEPKTPRQMEPSSFDESHLGHCDFDPDWQHVHFHKRINEDRITREPERTRNALTYACGA